MVSSEATIHTPRELVYLPAGWRWERLDRVCNGAVFDCPHSTPVLTEYGPYVVRTQDIISGVFRAEQAAHVSDATYLERTSRAEPRYGDLLYSREGTYFGIAAEVPPDSKVCLGQRMVLIRPSAESTIARYLRYWLNSPIMARFIHGYRDGTVAERLNLPTIRALPVVLPPIREQRAIACILGALDDKIELNRRMNRTLEAMARAIFQSWFVDFDPVRAKLALSGAEGAAGQAPAGLKPEIAALFPDRLVAVAGREMPEGWKEKTIGDLAEIVGGGTPSTAEPKYWTDDGHYWATPKDLSALSVPVLLGTERTITDAGLARISSGLLPVGTVLLSSRAPIGYLAIAEVPVAINQGFIALKPKNNVSNLFLLLWCSFAHDEIMSRANGSTFLEISKSSFRPIPLIVPTQKVMGAFGRLVWPIYRKIVENERQSRTLAALRDTLLPQLISGALRVADVERIVGRCL